MTETASAQKPRPKRAHRSPHGFGAYVTDLELIEYLGVPERTARPVLEMLDRDPKSGFPKKQELWGGRRYLPAVEEWLRKANGLKIEPPKGRTA